MTLVVLITAKGEWPGHQLRVEQFETNAMNVLVSIFGWCGLPELHSWGCRPGIQVARPVAAPQPAIPTARTWITLCAQRSLYLLERVQKLHQWMNMLDLRKDIEWKVALVISRHWKKNDTIQSASPSKQVCHMNVATT